MPRRKPSGGHKPMSNTDFHVGTSTCQMKAYDALYRTRGDQILCLPNLITSSAKRAEHQRQIDAPDIVVYCSVIREALTIDSVHKVS